MSNGKVKITKKEQNLFANAARKAIPGENLTQGGLAYMTVTGKTPSTQLLKKFERGGYGKVLYGHVESFKRGLTESTGEFFVNFVAQKVPFKISQTQHYSKEEQKLLRTLIVVPGTGKGQGQRNVILVLDKKGYISIVRDEL